MNNTANQEKQENLEKLADFDPDFPPDNHQNKLAAWQRGLIFNEEEQAYVDPDGCLIRDRFGQPY